MHRKPQESFISRAPHVRVCQSRRSQDSLVLLQRWFLCSGTASTPERCRTLTVALSCISRLSDTLLWIVCLFPLEQVCPAQAITIEAEPREDGSRRTTRSVDYTDHVTDTVAFAKFSGPCSLDTSLVHPKEDAASYVTHTENSADEAPTVHMCSTYCPLKEALCLRLVFPACVCL